MKVLVRADAGPSIGAGHVLRCLALAQALRDAHAEVALASVELPDSLRSRWAAETSEFETLASAIGGEPDARATRAFAQRIGADWIVLDGYRFDQTYQAQLWGHGTRLAVIDDDGHARHYHADLVLNQNLHANEALYAQREPDTRLLLGTRFTLLRREFMAWSNLQRPVPAIGGKVLVTLGGADPDNVTQGIVHGLSRVRADIAELIAVIGPSYPHRAGLERSADEWSGKLRILVDVRDMAPVIAAADMAISGAGSTSWELAFMRLPTLSVILADNQVAIAHALEAAGVARNLGWHHALTASVLADAVVSLLRDAAARRAMSERGRALIDGEGARRVCAALFEALPCKA